MTKDEMKDKISMALKDPILQQGFEIICKENAELKKENTELKTRWQCRNKYMCNENGKGVPCYIYYGCLNCHYKIEQTGYGKLQFVLNIKQGEK